MPYKKQTPVRNILKMITLKDSTLGDTKNLLPFWRDTRTAESWQEQLQCCN